jgi:murein L,D-transpeptidase YafK
VARPAFPNRRTLAALVLLLAAGAGLADEIGPAPSFGSAPSFCPGAGDAVAVLTRKRELWLCRDGAPTARFQVALGQGGLDKRKKGDRRTPLGIYALGTPRPSGRYGVFIPIVYPTPEQASQGLTGGDVGIHGPPRGQDEPGATTAFDWTLGCVATGTDAEIEVIASFVRDRKPVLVVR